MFAVARTRQESAAIMIPGTSNGIIRGATCGHGAGVAACRGRSSLLVATKKSEHQTTAYDAN